MENDRTRVVELELLEPDQLLLVWGDGHESLYSHRLLRLECGCAQCVHEWTNERLLDPSRIAANIRLVSRELVGRYGVLLRFSDGHGTGIYTFERLRALCPCPECRTNDRGDREARDPGQE